MPPPAKISLLPAALRLQLDSRLKTSAFAGFHAHAAWLKAEGYAVGKSAIHAYAQRERQRIDTQAANAAAEGPNGPATATNQRIECLRIAATLGPRPADSGKLCDLAAELYRWAAGG